MKRIPSRNPLVRFAQWLVDHWRSLVALLLLIGGVAWISAQRGEGIDLVVAKQYIPSGQTISRDMLVIRTMPRARYPSDVLTADRFSADPSLAVGKISLRDVYDGEPLVARSLGEGLGSIAHRLDPNRLAVDLGTEWLLSEPPRLEPGDTIDLYGFDPEGGRALAVLEAVPILAVSYQEIPAIGGRPADRRVRSITLALVSDQARRLTEALGKGLRLEVAVRGSS